MNKSSIAAVALVALAIGFGISWYTHSQRPIELESGHWFGEQARALPEFELVDHRAQPLTRNDLAGHWNLLFFGYTHCPDICPIGLQTMADMVAAIDDPDVTEHLRIYFVSVDPERDRPEVLADYVGYFNADFVGATAPLERLRPLTRSLGIAHALRNKTEGSDHYDVDHSSAFVLVDPQAQYAGLFGAPQDAAALARDLTRIIERHPF